MKPPMAARDERAGGYAGIVPQMIPLSSVTFEANQRFSTGISEFDHVLGGLVTDSVVLIAVIPAGNDIVAANDVCVIE